MVAGLEDGVVVGDDAFIVPFHEEDLASAGVVLDGTPHAAAVGLHNLFLYHRADFVERPGEGYDSVSKLQDKA